MKQRENYVAQITILRLHPTFESYWKSNKRDYLFQVEVGIYETIQDAKKYCKERYNWSVGLAKTALANGWKQPDA